MMLVMFLVMILQTSCATESSKIHSLCVPLEAYTRQEQYEMLNVMTKGKSELMSRVIYDYGKLRNMIRASCNKAVD